MLIPTSCPVSRIDARTRAAWQTQVAAAKQAPGVLPLLMRQRHVLLLRFAAAYRRLRALPRRVRRHLQRHWHQSLAGVALLLVLQPTASWAANFTAGTAAALIDAINTANANGQADTITLTADITLTAADNGTYGATGLPVISSEITIEGQGKTIHRDSGAPDFRVLAVNGTGNLTLKETTISGGVAMPQALLDRMGGGILNRAGTVTLEGSTVSGNSAGESGGGVFNDAVYSESTLVLSNSTVSGNSAKYGGGIYNRALSFAESTVLLSNSTVSGNAARYSGGGMYSRIFFAESTLVLSNSTVSGNSAGDGGGGGMYNQAISAESTVILSNSIVSGNSAASSGGGIFNGVFSYTESTLVLSNSTVSGNSAGDGGGVFNRAHFAESTVVLSNSTVSSNLARDDGGGMFNGAHYHAQSTVVLSNSTVSGNSAGSGGGVFNRDSLSESAVVLSNSTVSGNSARFYGGGVCNDPSWYSPSEVSTVTLINSTVSRNAALQGGGIFNRSAAFGTSAVTLARSLLSGNAAATGAEISNSRYFYNGQYYGTATVNANNHNLFGHRRLTNAQAFSAFTPGAIDITATADGTTPTALRDILNPRLANNGGPTRTHNLVLDSPAIDAIPAPDCPPPSTDQRGVSRPQDGDADTVAACDIGAVEFPPTPSFIGACGTTTPTMGCTVNGVPNQPCIGTPGDDVIIGWRWRTATS